MRDGVLPVDKPVGPTSHDVVARARRALHERRIGHTGTLDPFASGLLLLCVGRATRIAEYLTEMPKRYRATMHLGEATDTDDLTGTVTDRSNSWQDLTAADVQRALARQLGTIRQQPPKYSAKKVDGERMHRRARRGEDVTAAPTEVTIHEIELIRFGARKAEFDVLCSSGTYIRAIARDVGENLGCYAHLTALRRTAIGPFTLDAAVPLDALDDADVVDASWISPLRALRHLARIDLDDAQAADIKLGRAPTIDALPAGPIVVAHGGELLAIGEAREGRLQPRKVMAA